MPEMGPARALGAAARRLRIDRGLTQQQVAERIGMSRSHYSNLESGRGMVSLVRLRVLCRVLDVALDDLVEAAWPEGERAPDDGDVHMAAARAWTFGEHVLTLGTPIGERRTAVVRCHCDRRVVWKRKVGRGLLAARAITSDPNLVTAIARHLAEANPDVARRLHEEGFLSALGRHQDLISVLDAAADAVREFTDEAS